MPTVLRENGFRFFFYSNEGNEPPHVHVDGGSGEMKIWIPAMLIEFSYGYSPREQRRIMEIIENNVGFLMEKWNEFSAKKV